MKRCLQWIFLLMFMNTVGLIQAQNAFRNGFENATENQEWTVFNATGTNQWHFGTATSHTGTGSAYISDDNGTTFHYSTSNNKTVTAIYHEVTLSAFQSYKVSYDYISDGENNYDFLRAFLVPTSEDLLGVDGYTALKGTPDNWIALDDGPMSGTSSWTHAGREFIAENDGTYRLVFYWANDNSQGSGTPAAIDNVVFKKFECYQVNFFTHESSTTESVTLSWFTYSPASMIEYGPKDFEEGTGTFIYNITEPHYTITGLEGSSLYDVYVSSDCGDGDYSESTKITVATSPLPITLPYYNDFENDSRDELPRGWTLRSGEAGVRKEFYKDNKAFNIAEGCVYTPKMAFPNGDLLIHFYGANGIYGTGYNLEIGVVTDPSLWDYRPIQILPLVNHEYVPYYVILEDIASYADSGYVVFKGVSDGNLNNDNTEINWNIDNLTIQEANSNRYPTNIIISDITTSSATISWDGLSTGVKYQVKYGVGNMGEFDTVMFENTNTITITDLGSGYTYQPDVRSIVGNDTSLWVNLGFFFTYPSCLGVDDLDVKALSSTSVLVDWKAAHGEPQNDSLVITYSLFKDLFSPDYLDTIVLSPNSEHAIIEGLQPDTLFELTVRTYNANTDCSWSVDFETATPAESEISSAVTVNESGATPLIASENYSYSQTIYPAQITNMFDVINSIAYHSSYYKNGGASYPGPQTRNIKIYMGNTDISVQHLNQKIPVDSLTLVYDGSYSFSCNGWDVIPLTTSFNNDGRNVVVTVIDTTGTGSSNGMLLTFRKHKGQSLLGSCQLYEYLHYMIEEGPIAPDTRFAGHKISNTCKAPLVMVDSIEATNVYLSWLPKGNATSWKVDYRSLGTSAWITSTASTSNTNATISNLQPGMIYEFRVSPICSDIDIHSTILVETSCNTFQVPYIEDFHTNQNNPCWTYGSKIMHDSPNVENHCLVMEPEQFVILPQFSAPINTLKVGVTLDPETYNIPIYIGVSANSKNITDGTVIDTLLLNSSYNAQFDVFLNEYTGQGEYIFIYTHNNIKIREIKVESISACPQVANVAFTNVTTTSMDVSWETHGFGDSWTAVIVPSGADISTGTPHNCTTNSITLTGLTGATDYDVYITTHCGNNHSEPVMHSITTPIHNPIEIPYHTDFSDASQNLMWQYRTQYGENYWTIDYNEGQFAPSLYITHTDDHLYEYDNSVSSVTMAYIEFVVAQQGDYQFQFDYVVGGESPADMANVYVVPKADINHNLSQLRSLSPQGWIPVTDAWLCKSSWWTHHDRMISLPKGEYCLAFIWRNTTQDSSYTFNHNPIAIDNLDIRHITCYSPIDLRLTENTSTSATIAWTPDRHSTNNWLLTINDEAPISVTEPTYTINDVNIGGKYKISLATDCGGGDLSSPVELSFTTACGDIERLPFENNFNNYSYCEPPCWNVLSGIVHISGDALRLTMDNDYPNATTTLPRLSDAIDLTSLVLTFKGRTDYNNIPLYVGVSDEPSLNDITIIDTLNLGYGNQNCAVHFDSYTGTGKYIVLQAENGDLTGLNEIIIDDLRLNEFTVCEFPVTLLSINHITDNSMTITWDANPAQTLWEVKCSDYSGNQMIYESNTTTYTVTGLAPGTLYTVSVRPKCEDGVYGAWSNTLEETTVCPAVDNFALDRVTNVSATLSWDALGENVVYLFEYGELGAFSDETGMVDIYEYLQVETEIAITDLAPSTKYEARVTTLCINEEGIASDVITFETLATAPEGIEEADGQYQFTIYPNPTSGTTTIKLSGIAGEVAVSVIDINGKIITTEHIECAEDCEKRVDVTNLPQGTYFVQVVSNEINKVKKLNVR